MRKYTLYLLVLFFVVSCAPKKDWIVFGEGDKQLSLNNTYQNLGSLKEGEQISFEYLFANTGKQNIQILNAVPTCGCTMVEYPKEPIMTDKKGKINVVYNSKGKTGKDKKSIVVQTNLPYPNDIIELSFEVVVETNSN